MSVRIRAGLPISLQVLVSGRMVPCDATITKVSKDEIHTTVPERHKVKIRVDLEQMERIVVQIRSDALYEATCSVTRSTADGVTLTYPDEIKRIQRRCDLRTPIATQARIAVPCEGKILPYAPAEVKNLSQRGCAIVFSSAIPSGAKVSLRLDLPRIGEIEIEGQARYCLPQVTPQGIHYLVGFEFMDVAVGTLQRIAWCVTEVHRKLVRKQSSSADI